MTRPQTTTDHFGQPLTTAHDSSRAAWDNALEQLLHFRGDPIGAVHTHNVTDDRFVMGSVLNAAYMLLGAASPNDEAVISTVRRAAQRAPGATPREQAHVAALHLLHAGQFFDAAQAWHICAADHPGDFVASRLAHDVCLHIGNDELRMAGARQAIEVSSPAQPSWGFAHGLLAFALEELDQFDEAAAAATEALRVDADDLWARHALAHVYESTARHGAAVDHLQTHAPRWREQTLLSNHMWWHMALSALNDGQLQRARHIADTALCSKTAFGLCDSTSLRWRLELLTDTPESAEVWHELADAWTSEATKWHTCGFVDLHAAMAFARAPDHGGAERFWRGVEQRQAGTAFNDRTFSEVVHPLTAGIAAFGRGQWTTARNQLAAAIPQLARIGGSVVQRNVVHRTFVAADERA